MEQFIVTIFAKLPKDIEQNYKDLKQQAFYANYPQFSAAKQKEHEDKFCSQQDIISFVIAFENNELIGGLHVLKRVIRLNDENILLGGIGGVWTRQDKRRKGVASLLIQKALGILQNNQCDIAYLCANITTLGKFYEKFGFQKLENTVTYIGKSGKMYKEFEGMIAPVCSDKIFLKIMKTKKPLDIGKGNW